MFVYETASTICQSRPSTHALDFIVVKTMVLSWSHLLLLLLHYYILLTGSGRQRARDFFGLILTAWITSSAIGSINISTHSNVIKVR